MSYKRKKRIPTDLDNRNVSGLSVRELLGLAILAAVVLTNVYDALFPVDLDDLQKNAESGWERVDRRAKEFLAMPEPTPEAVAEPVVINAAQRYSASIVQFLSVLIGLVLLYISFFLYETQQGAVQNRLEEWWIKINDIQTTSLSIHVRLIQSLSAFATRSLDVVFGARAISFHAVGASVCFALASANLYQYLNGWEAGLGESHLFNFFYWFALGITPALLKGGLTLTAWSALLCVLFWNDFFWVAIFSATIALRINQPSVIVVILGYFGSIVVACGLCFLSVGFIRLVLRRLDNSTKYIATVLWLTLISLPALFFYQPYRALNLLPLLGDSPLGLLSLILFFANVIINSFLLIPCGFFLIVTILLFTHKLLGELADRLVYSMQRFEVVKRTKLLFIVGSVLLAFGFGVETSTIAKLLEKAL